MVKRIRIESVLLLLLIGLVVLVVLSQANPLTNYPSRDGGAFNYIGNLILHGKLPYIDAWDSKPPGIFYLNAVGLWLGRDTRWGVWFIEFIFLSCATWISLTLLRKAYDFPTALFGTILWLAGLYRTLSGGNFTEEYPLLFNFAALFLFWESLRHPKNRIYDFALGITLALSFLFRANNIGVQVSIAITIMILGIIRKEFKIFFAKIAFEALGILAVLGSVGLYFYMIQDLKPMIDAAIIYNFSYSGRHVGSLEYIVWAFSKIGLIAWIGLAGYIIAVTKLARNIKNRAFEPIILLLVIGWPVEIFLSSLSGRVYGHYLMSWLPILAMVAGLGIFTFIPILFSTRVLNIFYEQKILFIAGVILVTVIGFGKQFQTYTASLQKLLFNRSTGIEKTAPVANYIRDHSRPEDTLFVWGAQVGINYMAKRSSPTPYLFYPGYVATSPLTSKMADSFYVDITQRSPAYIIDAHIDDPDASFSLNPQIRAQQIASGKGDLHQVDNLESVLTFIEENYHLESKVDGYDVYRLNSTP